MWLTRVDVAGFESNVICFNTVIHAYAKPKEGAEGLKTLVGATAFLKSGRESAESQSYSLLEVVAAFNFRSREDLASRR